MNPRDACFRITVWVMIVMSMMGASPLWSEPPAVRCDYDQRRPSLDHAREYFEDYDYVCAEREIADVLAADSLDTSTRCRGHVLLAQALYGQNLLNPGNVPDSTIRRQFVLAYEADSGCSAEIFVLDADRLQLLAMTAKAEVDSLRRARAAAAVVSPTGQEGGKWYKKWWAMALGIGVVAGAVALAGGGDGGGDSSRVVLDTIPGFPQPPD